MLDESWIYGSAITDTVLGKANIKKTQDCLARTLSSQPQCRTNFVRFFENQRKIHASGHSMQFAISDQEYQASIPKKFYQLPVELQDGLPSNWRETFVRKGWEFLEYRSGALPNPPYLSFGRVLLRLRHDCYDQWLQISQPEYGIPERLIDMIIVQTKSCSPDETLSKKKIFFTQYWRGLLGGSPEIRSNRSSCYSCHMTGMNRIEPAPGSVPANQYGRLKEFNETFSSYGDLDWGRAVDMGAYGPPMGRTVGCTDCHNGFVNGGRGMLNANHLSPRSAHRTFHKMGREFSMSPLVRFDPRNRALFVALDKVRLLSEEELQVLRKPRKLLAAKDISLVDLGGLVGPSAVDNQTVLDLLFSKDRISQAELSQASQILQRLTLEQANTHRKMVTDYADDLIQWLKKGDQCEKL